MSALELLTAEPGTVVRYRPPYEQGRDVMWCCEGMAVADERGVLIDTYWGGSYDPWVDKVADYEAVTSRFPVKDYADRDRLTVTHQHRLQRDEYLRIGAQPDYRTRVARQVDRVRDARTDLASAQWRLERASGDLAKLLAERSALTEDLS